MGHHSYEDAKKLVIKGLYILAVVTLVEVFFSLLGKGHIVSGVEDYKWVFYVISLIIIILSVYKAYYIIFEFMHMKYEVPSLVKTVLLPTALLIWAIIAFFWEGADWNARRTLIKDKNEEVAPPKTVDSDIDVYFLNENDN
jgi:cytochrome c oxidase subunit IV